MPSYTIHMAVAKKCLESNTLENPNDFLLGVIAPDMLEKPASHYGPYSSASNPDLYVEKNGLESSYNKGYFLHLMTDKLFYNEFLSDFSTAIYSDYDILNPKLINRYSLTIPPEIEDVVLLKEGETSFIHEDSICRFIDAVAAVAFKKDLQNGELCFLLGESYAACRDTENARMWYIRAAERGFKQAFSALEHLNN